MLSGRSCASLLSVVYKNRISRVATSVISVVLIRPLRTDQHFERPGLPPLSEEAIYCQRSRTAQDQRREAGEVQEVTFIARRSKLRAGSSHGHELDRTESVGQMHSKNSHQQKRGHRQTDNGHKGAQK